jgi:hypothetical protein
VQINQTMQQFAKENARMEMTQEMMGDTLDSALDDETTEDDAAELVGQVRTVLDAAVVDGQQWLAAQSAYGLLQDVPVPAERESTHVCQQQHLKRARRSSASAFMAQSMGAVTAVRQSCSNCVLLCVCVQVLDEIGVDLSALMGTAPQRKVAQQQPAAAAATGDSELQDLQARLAMLRS